MSSVATSTIDWLEASTADPYLYLTTIGRRTGVPHTIEIWFAFDGQTLLLLSGGGHMSDWVRNVKADPHVIIDLGGEIRPGVGRIVEADSMEELRARRLLLAKYQKGEELDSWGRAALVVAIDLPEANRRLDQQ